MVHEKDFPLGLVSVGYRSLGENGKGVLYPLDDDHVGGGLLLDLLGQGKQRWLVQNAPPKVVCIVQLHFSKPIFGPRRPRKALKLPQLVRRRLYRATC
jgi:hypothetical protein